MLFRGQMYWTARLTLLGAFIHILFLTGCSTFHDKEHRSVDWQTIGYEDAITGQKPTQLADQGSTLTEFDINPNLHLYRMGYAQGLKEYCHPTTAFQLGREGNDYPSQCPQHLTDQLKMSYRYGRDIYDLNLDIRQTRKLLNGKNHALQKAEQALSEYKTEIVKPDATTPTQRNEIPEEGIELSKQINDIKAEIGELNLQLSTRQTQLNRLVSVLY